MLRKLFVLTLFLLFLFPIITSAGNYLNGALLRAEGDIKVYLINDNVKRWVSSIEVFNLNNFKWQNVKVVSKKEVAVIKEGEPIVLGSASPSPTPVSTTIPSPTPPVPAKVNVEFPAPDYVRADWLISDATLNYGRVGQKIVFKYSDKVADKIENFRLYEKKPGDAYFVRIASFEEVPSTGCEDIDIDGEWMFTEAGQCGYWSIQRVVLPGGRGTTAYLPAADYLVGEYVYYVAGVDKDGLETQPSGETKLVFLDPVNILNPTDNQPVAGVYPNFKWTIAGGWPKDSVADYFVMISDNKNAQNPVWTKQLKIPLGATGRQLTYDGLGLNPASTYWANIYGHYRKSEYDPDYISISSSNPGFWIRRPGWTSLFKNIFAVLLRPLVSLDF